MAAQQEGCRQDESKAKEQHAQRRKQAISRPQGGTDDDKKEATAETQRNGLSEIQLEQNRYRRGRAKPTPGQCNRGGEERGQPEAYPGGDFIVVVGIFPLLSSFQFGDLRPCPSLLPQELCTQVPCFDPCDTSRLGDRTSAPRGGSVAHTRTVEPLLCARDGGFRASHTGFRLAEIESFRT